MTSDLSNTEEKQSSVALWFLRIGVIFGVISAVLLYLVVEYSGWLIVYIDRKSTKDSIKDACEKAEQVVPLELTWRGFLKQKNGIYRISSYKGRSKVSVLRRIAENPTPELNSIGDMRLFYFSACTQFRDKLPELIPYTQDEDPDVRAMAFLAIQQGVGYIREYDHAFLSPVFLRGLGDTDNVVFYRAAEGIKRLKFYSEEVVDKLISLLNSPSAGRRRIAAAVLRVYDEPVVRAVPVLMCQLDYSPSYRFVSEVKHTLRDIADKTAQHEEIISPCFSHPRKSVRAWAAEVYWSSFDKGGSVLEEHVKQAVYDPDFRVKVKALNTLRNRMHGTDEQQFEFFHSVMSETALMKYAADSVSYLNRLKDAVSFKNIPGVIPDFALEAGVEFFADFMEYNSSLFYAELRKQISSHFIKNLFLIERMNSPWNRDDFTATKEYKENTFDYIIHVLGNGTLLDRTTAQYVTCSLLQTKGNRALLYRGLLLPDKDLRSWFADLLHKCEPEYPTKLELNLISQILDSSYTDSIMILADAGASGFVGFNSLMAPPYDIKSAIPPEFYKKVFNRFSVLQKESSGKLRYHLTRFCFALRLDYALNTESIISGLQSSVSEEILQSLSWCRFLKGDYNTVLHSISQLLEDEDKKIRETALPVYTHLLGKAGGTLGELLYILPEPLDDAGLFAMMEYTKNGKTDITEVAFYLKYATGSRRKTLLTYLKFKGIPVTPKLDKLMTKLMKNPDPAIRLEALSLSIPSLSNKIPLYSRMCKDTDPGVRKLAYQKLNSCLNLYDHYLLDDNPFEVIKNEIMNNSLEPEKMLLSSVGIRNTYDNIRKLKEDEYKARLIHAVLRLRCNVNDLSGAGYSFPCWSSKNCIWSTYTGALKLLKEDLKTLDPKDYRIPMIQTYLNNTAVIKPDTELSIGDDPLYRALGSSDYISSWPYFLFEDYSEGYNYIDQESGKQVITQLLKANTNDFHRFKQMLEALNYSARDFGSVVLPYAENKIQKRTPDFLSEMLWLFNSSFMVNAFEDGHKDAVRKLYSQLKNTPEFKKLTDYQKYRYEAYRYFTLKNSGFNPFTELNYPGKGIHRKEDNRFSPVNPELPYYAVPPGTKSYPRPITSFSS